MECVLKKSLVITAEDGVVDSKSFTEDAFGASGRITLHFYPNTEKSVTHKLSISYLKEALDNYGVELASAKIESNKSSSVVTEYGTKLNMGSFKYEKQP